MKKEGIVVIDHLGDEWKDYVREKPPGTYNIFDVGVFKDTGDAVAAYVRLRKDSIGRVRRVEIDAGEFDNLQFPFPLGGPRRFPHPSYVYGYKRAVAHEDEMLTLGLFAGRRPWRQEVDARADGLLVDENPYGPYEAWVQHYQDIAATVRDDRPLLIEALEPVAHRHGLDVVPWGMGWMVEQVARVQTTYEMDTAPPEGPPRSQRDPAADALLLYIYLTGHLNDERTREIIQPVINLKHIEDPKRRVQRIKSELGITRPVGRPRGRSRVDSDAASEVYELLESQVAYLTRVLRN